MKNFSMIFEVQCEQLYANKVDRVDKMDESLDSYILYIYLNISLKTEDEKPE